MTDVLIDKEILEDLLEQHISMLGHTGTVAYMAQQALSRPAPAVQVPEGFASDVMTAAGLLAHGKRDKGLAERLRIGAVAMLAAPTPATVATEAVAQNARDAAFIDVVTHGQGFLQIGADGMETHIPAESVVHEAVAQDDHPEHPLDMVAQGGGVVAWQYRAGPGDDGWSIAFRNEVLAEVAAKNGQEVRALYTRPDSGRVAELEAQLAKSREREGRMREALHKLLSCGRGTSGRLIIERDEEQAAWASLAADKEKNDE